MIKRNINGLLPYPILQAVSKSALFYDMPSYIEVITIHPFHLVQQYEMICPCHIVTSVKSSSSICMPVTVV